MPRVLAIDCAVDDDADLAVGNVRRAITANNKTTSVLL